MNHSPTLPNRIWKAFLFTLLVLFMLLSINSILPIRWQFPQWRLSPHLSYKAEKTADGIRSDYKNSKGIITVALDKNYATVIKTLNQDGNCILEKYFDDHSRPAMLRQAILPLDENITQMASGSAPPIWMAAFIP